MASSKLPALDQLHEAIFAIDSVVIDLQRRQCNLANGNSAIPAMARRGLLSFNPSSEQQARQSDQSDCIGAWEEAHQKVTALPAVYWLRRQASFLTLTDQLHRQAARSGGNFARPEAELRLIQGVLSALLTFRFYRDRRTAPGGMGAADWDEAIRAVRTLSRLERQKGLNLSAAIWGPSLLNALPPFWADHTVDRLLSAKVEAPKPHSDGKQLERRVMKHFAIFLLRTFGRAPLSMVETFGEVIQYTPGTIKRSLDRWLEEAASLPVA